MQRKLVLLAIAVISAGAVYAKSVADDSTWENKERAQAVLKLIAAQFQLQLLGMDGNVYVWKFKGDEAGLHQSFQVESHGVLQGPKDVDQSMRRLPPPVIESLMG